MKRERNKERGREEEMNGWRMQNTNTGLTCV